MKNIFKSLCVAFIISILACLVPFEGECREISDSVFRIHILANSDSEADQNLKLKVRDAVLKKSEELFSDASGKEQAMKLAQENLTFLTQTAQQTVYSEGYDYPVTVEIKRMYFSTRYYEDVTMPSGVYDALQIRIGKAEGKNWWCVMYPSLCLSVADEENPLKDELTHSQFTIVTSDGKFQLRFKAIEIFNKLTDFFSE